MPEDVSENFPELSLDLYDSDTGAGINAVKVIDITDVCEATQQEGKQAFIEYGFAVRGVIARLRHSYPGEDFGTTVHHFPEEMSVEELAEAYRQSWAALLGCDSMLLAETVIEHIPEEPAPWDPDRREHLKDVKERVERGEVRHHIPCDEARGGWFSMAYRMYVGDDPEPDIPLDYEVGIHIANCPTDECQRLRTAYYELLRPSQPEDSEMLVSALDSLQKGIDAKNN